MLHDAFLNWPSKKIFTDEVKKNNNNLINKLYGDSGERNALICV